MNVFFRLFILKGPRSVTVSIIYLSSFYTVEAEHKKKESDDPITVKMVEMFCNDCCRTALVFGYLELSEI